MAKAGFISTSYDTKDGLVLLPELQFDYAVLDFRDLHVGKKVKKLLTQNDYKLSFDTRLDEVIEKISSVHKYNWLKGEYVELLKTLHVENRQGDDFRLMSVELISMKTDELIAGEVGYVIGKTYTSLTGFSSREKKYNNCGTLQLVLLAKYLEKNGFSFWNLGHPHMQYKQKLGSKIYTRVEFLKRWNETIH